MKINWTLIIIGAIVLAGAFGGGYFLGVQHQKTVEITNTVVKTDTVFVSVLKPVIVTKTTVDTVYHVNADTVYVLHNDYIAKADTAYRNDSLSVAVEWHSSIPVDAKGYFEINIHEVLKTLPVYTTEPIAFYKSFSSGVIFTVVAEILIFLGIHFL